MTTARDVIAAYLCRNDEYHQGPCVCLLDGGAPKCSTYTVPADGIVEDLLSAPDSVRLELAGMLNPWRPIETAPKDGTKILGWCPDPLIEDENFRPVIMWWRAKKFPESEWKWRSAQNDSAAGHPTHWLPLPAPPSEDKLK